MTCVMNNLSGKFDSASRVESENCENLTKIKNLAALKAITVADAVVKPKT